MIREAPVQGHFINSIRAQRHLRPDIAIAELIDNALDSGAKRITIDYDEDKDVTFIRDDGNGCSDVVKFFAFGDSDAGDGNIGRYGVGGSKAGAILSDVEVVTTYHGGIRRTGRIEWSHIAQENLPFRFEADERPGVGRGTQIALHGDRRDLHSKSRAAPSRKYWSKLYRSALAEGISIVVNGIGLEPRPFPALKMAKSITGELVGKRYKATAGILVDEAEASKLGWDPGFYVSFARRLLNEIPSWDNAEEYSGAPIWVYVDLIEEGSSKWHLDEHKTDFTERQDLFADLVPQLSAMLESAVDNKANAEIRVIAEVLSTTIASALGGTTTQARIREKRASPTNKSGTVEPADSGRQRLHAQKVDPSQPGCVIEFPDEHARRKQAWSVQFAHMGQQAGIGIAYVNRSTASMKFNLDSDWVSSNKGRPEVLIPIALQSIWCEAGDVIQDRLWTGVGLRTLAIEEPNAAKRMSLWMAEALRRIEIGRSDAKKIERDIRKRKA